MSCKSAIFDKDTGRYNCKITECECLYYRPDSKRCLKEYGEGPDKEVTNERKTKSKEI